MYVAVYTASGENLHQTVFAKFNFAMLSWKSENSLYVSIESQLHILSRQNKSAPYTDNLNWIWRFSQEDIIVQWTNQTTKANNTEFQVTPTV